MHLNERAAKAAVALFFVLLALLGLWTVDDYSGSYDETAEQAILSSNMKEYALRWKNWESHGTCGWKAILYQLLKA